MWAKLLSLLLQLLRKDSPENPSPRDDRIISIQEIYKILRDKFPGATVYVSDYQKSLFYYADMEAFLKQDATNRIKYQNDVMDCDDFAYRLMGQLSVPPYSKLAKGIVWTNAHALNCFISETGEFFFIEPQQDKIMRELEPWMGSAIRFVAM